MSRCRCREANKLSRAQLCCEGTYIPVRVAGAGLTGWRARAVMDTPLIILCIAGAGLTGWRARAVMDTLLIISCIAGAGLTWWRACTRGWDTLLIIYIPVFVCCRSWSDWVACVHARLGVPRWLTAATISLGIIFSVWLCLVIPSSAPKQRLRALIVRGKVSYGDIERVITV